MTPLQQQIIKQLANRPTLTIKELADELNQPYDDVFEALTGLLAAGYVNLPERGRYALQEAADYPQESLTL